MQSVASQNQLAIENDVRECLSRLLRLESTLATLSLATNVASTNHWNCVNQGFVAVHQLLSEQRQMLVEIKTEQSLSQSPALALACHSKEPSPEQACGFPNCTFQLAYTAKRPCSAVQSLRHMRVCTYCPPDQCRFLAIAMHMQMFRSPRQHHSHVDSCCWCGSSFSELILAGSDTQDQRAKHRKSCLQTTIQNLQSTEHRDQTVMLLESIWDRELDCLSPAAKRGRVGLSPVVAAASWTDAALATSQIQLPPPENDDYLGFHAVESPLSASFEAQEDPDFFHN